MGMTAEQVDHHSNIEPSLIAPHRLKTAKIDQPQIAKSARCRRTQALHDAKMALKDGKSELARQRLEAIADPDRRRPKPKRKWPSRPFNSKGKRKVRHHARV
jgi:hypothetical protein